jgi:hypothetical protein
MSLKSPFLAVFKTLQFSHLKKPDILRDKEGELLKIENRRANLRLHHIHYLEN